MTLLWHWKIYVLIITGTITLLASEGIEFRIHNNMLWDNRINYLILVYNSNCPIFLFTSYMGYFCLTILFGWGKCCVPSSVCFISVKLYHCLQVTIWDCFVSSAASYVGWQDYRKSIVLGQFSFYIEQIAVWKLEKKIGFVSLSMIDYRNTMTNLIFMKLK